MKLINVVGDSLSMVRPQDNICGDDLYWVLLQQQLGNDYYVINHSRRRNDTTWVVETMQEEILSYKAFALVLHLGIVDCFPRLFTKTEHKILSFLSGIGLGFITRVVTRFASKHRYILTRYFKKVYVSLPDFEKNLHKIIGSTQDKGAAKNILLLGILDTTPENLARNFEGDKHIHSYDVVLRQMARTYKNVHYIDVNAYFVENNLDPVLPDGHHLRKETHPHFAAILKKAIHNLERPDV